MDSKQQNLEDNFNEQINKMLEENHPTQLLEAFNLLYKLFDNIAKNPTEQKFRSIKTTNAKLKQSLFSQQHIEEVLKAAGFTYDAINECWVLPDQNLFNLLPLIGELKMAIDLLQANLESPESYEKQLELQKRQRELKKSQHEKQEKEDNLKKQFDYDKQERKHMEKAKDSVAQQRQYGCNSKTFKDIGVDLNAKRG
ncbi:PUB domain protein (macronuclear) [Tetrahymena thermophila SB210]|uniref:PUB domain protein n=1 Tax=Tetrahymena thermophila (strain SB210) TaxID=312017 RepID=I7MLX1_TETTS|nr:PUB domain protein [Tetrahymena thermophila SB210]EAS03226.2 PUB domain protein [Tetrahymena thermophila SB210]|eukprot:XP_001023471.2 PUB domain protein [Tetrahymena thermophila SB210]